MIYTQMFGRCGNQLFRYAFTKKLEQLYAEESFFNYHFINNISQKDSSFFDNLSEFQVHYNKINEEAIIRKYGSIKQIVCYYSYRILEKIILERISKVKKFYFQNKLQRIMNYFGIYNLIQGDSVIGMSKEKNKFILGNYENKKYFDDIKEMLQTEIIPKKVTVECKEMLDIIKNNESVCISIRRGDFLNKELINSRYICTEEYFQKAIRIMRELIPDSFFCVFSDEIDWVRENFDFGEKVIFESGKNSISEKLYLMSRCKYFIISNSTFSWWAQYLAQNEEKIVISPDKWFKYDGFVHPLIDPDWILIEC